MGVTPPGGISPVHGAGAPQDFPVNLLEQAIISASYDSGKPTNLTALAESINAYIDQQGSSDPTQLEAEVAKLISFQLHDTTRGFYPDAKSIYMQYEIDSTQLQAFATQIDAFVQTQGLTWNLTSDIPSYTTLDQDFMTTVAWLDPETGIPASVRPLALQVQQLLVQLGPGNDLSQLLAGEAKIVFSPTLFTTCPGLTESDYNTFVGSHCLNMPMDFTPYIFDAAGTGPSALWQWIASPPASGASLANLLLSDVQTVWLGGRSGLVNTLNAMINQQAYGNGVSFFTGNSQMQWSDFQMFFSGFGVATYPTAQDYFNTGIYLAQNQGTQNAKTRMAGALLSIMQQYEQDQEPAIQQLFRAWLSDPTNVVGLSGGSLMFPAGAGDIGFVLNFIHDSIPFADGYAAACLQYYGEAKDDNSPLILKLLSAYEDVIKNKPSGTADDVYAEFSTWFTNPSNFQQFFTDCPMVNENGFAQALGFLGKSITDINVIGDFLEAGHLLYSRSIDATTSAIMQAIMAQAGNNFQTWTQAQMQSWFNDNILFSSSYNIFGLYNSAGISADQIASDFTNYIFPSLNMFGPGFPPPFLSNLINTGLGMVTSTGAMQNAYGVLFYQGMKPIWEAGGTMSDLVGWMGRELGTADFYTQVFLSGGTVIPGVLDALANVLGQSTALDATIAGLAQYAAVQNLGDPAYQIDRDLLAQLGLAWPNGNLADLHTWVVNTLSNVSFLTTYPTASVAALQELFTSIGYTAPNYLNYYSACVSWCVSGPGNNPLAKDLFAEFGTLLQDPSKTLADLQSFGFGSVFTAGFYSTYFGSGSTLTQADLDQFMTLTGMKDQFSYAENLVQAVYSIGTGYLTAAAGDKQMFNDFLTQLGASLLAAGGSGWQGAMLTYVQNRLWDFDGSTAFPFQNYPQSTEEGVTTIEVALGIAQPAMQAMMLNFRNTAAGDTTAADQAMFAAIYTDVLMTDWKAGATPDKASADFNAFFSVQDIAMKFWQAEPKAWSDTYLIFGYSFIEQNNDKDYVNMMTYFSRLSSGTDDYKLMQLMTNDLFTIGSYSTSYTKINTDLENFLYRERGNLNPATLTTLAACNCIQSTYANSMAIGFYQLTEYMNNPNATSYMKAFARGFQQEIAQFPNSGLPQTAAGFQTFMEGFFSQDLCFTNKGVSPADVQGFWATFQINQPGSIDPNYYVYTQLDSNYAYYWSDYAIVQHNYPSTNINYKAMQALDQVFVNIHNGISGYNWQSVLNEINLVKTWKDPVTGLGLDPVVIGYLNSIAALPPA